MLSRNNLSRLASVFLAVLCLPVIAQKAAPPPVKTAAVKGIVTNSVTGQPVARAHVVINGSSSRVYGAITTSDGRFSMLAVPPGTYSVTASCRGYQGSISFPSTPQITVMAGEAPGDVVIKLAPWAVISGQVVDEMNRPVSNAWVEVIGEDSRGGALSDDLGRFRIAGLSSSRFLVKARNNESLPPEIRTDGTVQVNYGATYYPSALSPESAAPVTTHAGHETADIIIKMKPAPLVRVSGALTGNPPEDTGVSLAIGSETGSSRIALDTMNRFSLWGLDPGRHTLFARWNSGNKTLRSGPTTVYVADTNIDNLVVALMPPFALGGKIAAEHTLSKADQEAWPAQYRKLLVVPAEGLSNPRATMRVDIDVSGDFKTPTLWPGTYSFSLQGFPENTYVKNVESGSLKLEKGMLDLSGGPPNQPLTLELGTDGGQITGNVLGPDDSPTVARVRLLLQRSEGYTILNETMAFNSPYSFTGLPPGKYFLLPLQNWGGASISPEEFAAIYSGRMEEVEVGSGEKVTKDLKLSDTFQ